MRTHRPGMGTHSLVKAWFPANEKRSPSHSCESGHHSMAEGGCSLLLWRCSAWTVQSSAVDGWKKGKTGSSVLPSAVTYWFGRWSSSTNVKVIFLFWPCTSFQPVFPGQSQAPRWCVFPVSFPIGPSCLFPCMCSFLHLLMLPYTLDYLSGIAYLESR